MEIKDLVDRFELLDPNNQNLADLRRSYIDKELSSIFRLSTITNSNIDIEDLRKAVIEGNLHSLFRIIDNDELRKLILEDNIWSLWKSLSNYTSTHFVDALKNFHINETQMNLDCLSRGQIKSKKWLIEELVKLDLNLGTIFLCAGWYATLATMLFESKIKIDKIRSFDMDPSCVSIAEVFNKPWVSENWRFKSITENILNVDYHSHSWTSWSTANNRNSNPITDSPTTIINTSCEHIQDFDKWYNLIPKNKIVILQTNNYFEIEDHVNCSTSLEEFRTQSPMTTILYEGELVLDKYTRYMRIGKK
jgi:hypothetical protein